jgi:hypothetical protein
MRVGVGVGAHLRACDFVRVALLIQHSMRVRHIVCGLSGSTIFFRYFLKNDSIFGIKILNIKCVFWFSLQLLSETFLILRRIQWDTGINVKMSLCKVLDILGGYSRNLNFLDKISEKAQISNLIKIRPVGAELFYVDERTDKPYVTNNRFSKFCESLK